MPRLAPLLFLTVWCVAAAQAQDFKPPDSKLPDKEVLKGIENKAKTLRGMINLLAKQGLRDAALVDVEVYLQAARNIVEHNEFFHKDSAAWTLDVLDRGALRARLLAAGDMPWTQARGLSVARGFRSRIDGTVQPYAYTLPRFYGKDPAQKWPIEVWLHGRDKTLTEVKFLRNHHGEKEADLDHIRIDIFGRGNNAYRWAGETDVFEAVDHFLGSEKMQGRDRLIDPNKIVLRGFSMGGAGTWHLGLHFPDRWCAVNPGAGFTTTRGYIKGFPDKLPTYQEPCLHIYDALDYAENAYNVPVFAYSGGKDAQKLAADLIEERLASLKIPMRHIIAPELPHQYPGPWQAKVTAAMKETVDAGRAEYPGKIRFVTYTLKYNSCFWVEVLGLNKHYERTTVKADRVENGFVIKTENVRTLHLRLPAGASTAQEIDIDGQKMTLRPWLNAAGAFHLYLDKHEGAWRSLLPQRLFTMRTQRPQKILGLTGPIDDAFTDAFLCITGSEKPWHETTERYAQKNLERFQKEWSKFFRGQVPVKEDIDVSAEDIASRNLILFGDPASNHLIAQVLDGLPLRWDEKKITLAGKTYGSGDHVPVLIFPNPLNTNRYVVINSGHTFRGKDLEGTNALLYPRLGDWAVLRLAGGEDALNAAVADAGLFDEFWQP